MANCTKCGKAVGCGCNLKKGLCATCTQQNNTPKPVQNSGIKELVDLSNADKN